MHHAPSDGSLGRLRIGERVICSWAFPYLAVISNHIYPPVLALFLYLTYLRLELADLCQRVLHVHWRKEMGVYNQSRIHGVENNHLGQKTKLELL